MLMLKRNTGRRRFLAGSLAAAAGLAAGPARGAEDFLSGATLRILIPNSAGSGQDIAARLFARHLEARLPATRISAENHTKANGRVAALMAWEAEPDGLTLCFLNSNLLYAEILQEEELPFSMTDFAWLGSLSLDRRVMVVGNHTGIEKVEQLLARQAPLLQAADGANSSHYQAGLLVNALLGAWIRPVTGFNSSARSLALIRGEVDCLLGTWDNMTPVLDAGAGRVLLRLNDCDLPPEHGRVPWLGELPLHAGCEPVLAMIDGQSQLGRSVATSPGTPADRLGRLRALFLDIARDPAFAEEASANGLLVRPTTGEAIAVLLARLLADPAAAAESFRWALACGQARADSGQAC